MRFFFVILFLFPATSFAQEKDYKTYDKAVKYNNEGNIEKAIKYRDGNISQVANILNVTRPTLYSLIGKYNIAVKR